MQKYVIALGNFDGVHIGHRQLIREAAAIAQREGIKAAVYTFEQHPQWILQPDSPIKLITSNAQRSALIKGMNVDQIHFEVCDKKFLSLSPREFTHNILTKIWNVRYVVVGHSFQFGKNGKGNVQTLLRLGREYGFEAVIIPPVTLDDVPVSSTLVRAALSEGDIPAVNRLLGRRYAICGSVEHGKKLARQLGFPTMNIYPPDYMALPKNGVYLTRTSIGRDAPRASISNVGVNPTVHDGGRRVETHVLDYCCNAYSQKIEVAFEQFIRPEIKFDSIELLAEQMKRDIAAARSSSTSS